MTGMPGNSMTRQHENPRWLKTNKVDYRNLFRSSPLFILVLILLNDSKTYKTNTVCQKLFLINLTGLAFFFIVMFFSSFLIVFICNTYWFASEECQNKENSKWLEIVFFFYFSSCYFLDSGYHYSFSTIKVSFRGYVR